MRMMTIKKIDLLMWQQGLCSVNFPARHE